MEPLEEPEEEAEPDITQLKNDLTKLINNERRDEGLEVLKVNTYLNSCAEKRAKELTKLMGHMRPDGSHYSTVIDDKVMNFRSASELCFGGKMTAEEAVEMLKESEKQWANVIDSDYDLIGINVYYDPDSMYKCYWEILLIDSREPEQGVFPDVNPDNEPDVELDTALLGEEFTTLLNRARVNAGLEPLKVVPYLNGCAETRAKELTQRFSHTRPDNKDFTTVIDDNIFLYGNIVETCCAGYTSAAEAIESFRNSETHWRGLMMSETPYIGINVHYDPDSEYKYYWEIITASVLEGYETPPTQVEVMTEEQNMISLINSARVEKGLSPLTVIPYLSDCAKIRAEEFRFKPSSIRPDGTSFDTVVDQEKILCVNLCELAAAAEYVPSSAFDSWSDSEKYQSILMNKDANSIGIALHYGDDGKYYWDVLIGDVEDRFGYIDFSESRESIEEFINKTRREKGLKPLVIVPYLNKCADIRAEELETELGHTRPDGTHFPSVIDDEIFDYSRILECAGFCYGSVAGVGSLMLESETDYMNITNEDVEYMGIGVYCGEDNKYYWDVLLGNTWDSPEKPGDFGDINCDEKVDIFDYICLVDYLNSSKNGRSSTYLTTEQLEAADCFNDGIITEADAKILSKYILGRCDSLPYKY